MKKISAIMLVCVLILSILAVPAGAVVDYRYGMHNTTINVTFTNDYNSTWKSEIMSAASTWQSASSSYSRKLQFVNKTGYNDTDGISFNKQSFSNNTIASATRYVGTRNGREYILYGRIQFNTNHNFTSNISQATSPNSTSWGVYDIQSIALHELGHPLGLGDNDNSSTVMYQHGQARRTLSTTDTNDLKSIYNVIIANSFSPQNAIDDYDDIEISTSITYVSLSEDLMVNASDLVVRGKVKEVLPGQWNTQDGESPSIKEMSKYDIFHDVIIEVDDVYKGNFSGKEIRVRRIGGIVDNVKQTLDTRDYIVGDEVILYLIEGSDVSSSNDKSVCYSELNNDGQLFIVNDTLAITSTGKTVDIEEQVMSKIS
ncbi:matrixin family metalloprotease [Methanolapillus millepedarum]|uniref:Peptidase M10 metallopeptidase domain-containing protein n=1 Tax=Methanolapillus millepedarum TaxID=3028296 RepID=A0AA96ZWH3_9EURY|nr:hypothetical protein MsAc7_15440 [Methanosarcinaceae archaeon Ac7]